MGLFGKKKSSCCAPVELEATDGAAQGCACSPKGKEKKAKKGCCAPVVLEETDGEQPAQGCCSGKKEN